MKRIAATSCLLLFFLSLWAGTHTIYVSDRTGWSVLDLYAWGDSEAFGRWPGATSAPEVTIGGTRFRTYSFTADDNKNEITLHLIFHNNVGENQPGDYRQLITLTQPRDYYLEVTHTTIRELTPPEPAEEGTLTVDNTTSIGPDNRVIYELSLYDFTQAGTLRAAQQRLTEMRRLGIDILWLMPIHPRSRQGRIGSLGSPYAPSDYKAVNSDFGTLQDLKNFVNQAHDLGMDVWLDWVPNHTGLDHVWVSAHPDYYLWKNGSISHPNDYSDVYQLNYQSSALRAAMMEAMIYWVNEADIDGFRCDYVSSPAIPLDFWQQAIPALQNNSRNKHVEVMGEADFSDRKNQYLLSAGFDYDYAWGFADGLKAVGQGTNAQNARSAAENLLNTLSDKYSQMSRMTYLTNHDDIGNNFSSNYMTVLGSNVPPMTVMYFTFFGMPLLYTGQEIGQTKILNYFEHNSINWNSINTKIHNTIRSLIALKHTLPALSDGTSANRANTRLLNTSNTSVIAYEKTKGDNIVLVLISLADQPVTVTLSGLTSGQYTRVLNSSTITSGCYIEPVNWSSSATVTLEAKGYQVFSNTVPTPTPTDVKEAKTTSTRPATKILHNGQLIIIREEKMFDVLGRPL